MQIEVTRLELELIKNALYEIAVAESVTAEDFKKDYNLDDESFDDLTIQLRRKLERLDKK